MVVENGKPVILALNKIDLISKSELEKKYDSKKMQSDFFDNYERVEISALKGKGFKKIFNLTNKILKKSQETFTTSALNKMLEKFVNANSPPSISRCDGLLNKDTCTSPPGVSKLEENPK